jgi:hypothetical protein
MQEREKNREFTACDKCYGEIYGSGRMRAKQTRGGVSNVRATQRDAKNVLSLSLAPVRLTLATSSPVPFVHAEPSTDWDSLKLILVTWLFHGCCCLQPLAPTRVALFQWLTASMQCCSEMARQSSRSTARMQACGSLMTTDLQLQVEAMASPHLAATAATATAVVVGVVL